MRRDKQTAPGSDDDYEMDGFVVPDNELESDNASYANSDIEMSTLEEEEEAGEHEESDENFSESQDTDREAEATGDDDKDGLSTEGEVSGLISGYLLCLTENVG